MNTESPKYAIGIDLGTTHSALSAVVPTTEAATVPEPFAINQVVAAGETSARPLLPSFLYLPAEAEFPDDAFALPWSRTKQKVVGEFARSKGATTPSRLVSSAKSWLSHAKVDRRAAILPWGASSDVAKVSPVAASAEYLRHLADAWNSARPDAPLAEQDVVLTVPASFDAVARELTLEAAREAGFERAPRLLEEPQAALYDWVAQSQGTWRQQVAVGDSILVIDIGGGTTDFSLISVAERDGSLELERIAVGDHILLGGDNMDLALAHAVRVRLEAEGKQLDAWQMVALTHGCRAAKETLLGDEAPAAVPVVIPGRSSRLLGGTLRTELTLEQVNAVLLEGFFPSVGSDARPEVPPRVGLTAIGLPYASDAAISRHLASFLRRASQRNGAAANPDAGFPTKVLFNGGVTRSPVVRTRLIELLNAWAAATGQAPPKPLTGTDAELAVSRGAAYYARAVAQGGVRIRSATVRSHYIGIQRSELAVPGIPPRIDAVCVAPFGMEEGSEVSLEQSFGLLLGQPVSFRFFSSSLRDRDGVGAIVDPAELSELPPLETTLGPADPADASSNERGFEAGHEVVEVRLEARLTEVGTLELAFVDVASGQRWKLSFNVRAE